ncbi:MAG: hypothetical protein HOL45_07400 [Chloroflexi bacterium]|nr:hypothetical protein [Chloroflexota bacterium]
MFSASINPRRIGLQTLIVSVVVSAVLAIFSLLRGEFSDTDGQILVTALSVAAASMLTLANGVVMEQGRSRLVAAPAILVSILGFALLIVQIWTDFDSTDQIRLAVSAIFLGTMLTHWALVSITRLPSQHQWLQLIAYPSSGLLATLLIAAIWEKIEGSANVQITGVVGIVTVSVSIILPVLQRLSRDETSGRKRVRYCPYCGEAVNAGRRGTTCSSCGTAFRVLSA